MLPPGPRAPKLWQLAHILQDFVGYLEACAARYGPVFTLRLHPITGALVVATRPADLRTIFTRCPERFVPELAQARVLEPILGPKSMFLTTGETHHRQRTLVRPAVRGNLVERWSDRITTLASEELEQIPTGRQTGMRQPMRDITLNLICRLVLGVDSPERYDELRRDIATGVGPRDALLLWFPTLWHRNGRLNPARGLRIRRQSLHRMMAEQIAMHRQDPQLARRDDALALLIRARDENGRALTDRELIDQLMTLLAAGHESTAAALAWALERLSRTPAAQARLASELGTGREDYLNAVVKETLRMRPPVLDAIRTVTEDIELGGYRISRGTLVSAGFTVTHHAPDLWPDPLAFRPERFLGSQPDPYTYMPFGGGNRRCIGSALGQLEMRIVLRETVRRFVVMPAPRPQEAIKLVGVTLAPARDAQVVLQRRPLKGAA